MSRSCFNQTSSPTCSTFITADQASRSHCDRLSWYEIFVIQQAILDAIQDCDSCVTISNASPITSYSSIDSVTVVSGGTDYQPIEASVNIIHPTGSGEDIDITVSNTGEITSFTINSGGNNYDPVVAEADATGVGNGDALFNVVVGSNGTISVVQVLNGGTGYSVGDTIPITHPEGTGADVEVASVGSGGVVLSTVVKDAGQDYEPILAEVEINHPTGFGFQGIVNTNSGAIIGISIQDGGTGYVPLYPTLDIDGAGVGAEFSFNIDSGTGEILSVSVDEGGYGYSDSDDVTVVPAPTSSGSGADLSLVTTTPSGVCSADWPVADPVLYYQVYVGQVTNQTVSKRINFIKEYFECLGYTFEIQPNPNTNSTLQWKICW